MRTARAIPLLAVAAVATIAASSPSRADTMYLYDADLGKRRGNDAEVCHFSFVAENFEAGQQATWWVENASGTDALRGVLTMDATGAAVTGAISLSNGTYKLFWETGADGAKRFTVNCPQASQQPTGTASASASPSAGATASASRSASPSSSPSASSHASAAQSAEPSGTPSGSEAATSGTPGATATPAPDGSGHVQDGLSLGSGSGSASSMAGVGLLALGGLLAVACLVVSEVLLRRSWRRR
ncbi:hypothetical protein OG607_23730 [Streptomyces sp. NBC_01537]|uniref:hypothetical protein n=1 Tax=Streptomyces sp. NBC_01537 TaxID=2903896 RepID=UPI0038689A19